MFALNSNHTWNVFPYPLLQYSLAVVGYIATSLTLTENSISTKDIFLCRVSLNDWDWTLMKHLS